MLPVSLKEGVKLSLHDALFMSTSCVCITGLVTVDVSDTFSVFGQAAIAVLIQIGGLGITTIGLGFISMAGKKMRMRDKVLLREALNYPSMLGLQGLIKWVLLTTFIVEAVGAVLSFLVFVQDYPIMKAIGMGIFHSISSFNNAGFDLMEGSESLAAYENNIPMNIITSVLVILGGLGFFVISELAKKRNPRKWSLHAKVVILMTVILTVSATILIKVTNPDISWLTAYFTSTATRSSGFATHSIADFNTAGLAAMMFFMFIGAAPGSTGGGIKVTSAFTIMRAIIAYPSGRSVTAFKRRIPSATVHTAFTVFVIALGVIIINVFLLCVFEPDIPFEKLVFEALSTYATVGLSTGITPDLSMPSKICLIITMYLGRMGSLTIVSLFTRKHIQLTELPVGQLPIG